MFLKRERGEKKRTLARTHTHTHLKRGFVRHRVEIAQVVDRRADANKPQTRDGKDHRALQRAALLAKQLEQFGDLRENGRQMMQRQEADETRPVLPPLGAPVPPLIVRHLAVPLRDALEALFGFFVDGDFFGGRGARGGRGRGGRVGGRRQRGGGGRRGHAGGNRAVHGAFGGAADAHQTVRDDGARRGVRQRRVRDGRVRRGRGGRRVLLLQLLLCGAQRVAEAIGNEAGRHDVGDLCARR